MNTATTEIYTFLPPLSLHDALPICAHQRRTLQGQHAAGRGDGGEGAVIDPPQPVPAVERTGPPDDGAVVRLVRADDHLGGLAGRGEARRMGVAATGVRPILYGVAHADRKSTRLNSSH